MTSLHRLWSVLQETSGPDFKNRVVQLIEMMEMTLRGHVHPSEYFAYGFSRRGVTRSDMAHYMGNHEHWNTVLPALNPLPWKKLVQNKWFFQLHFSELGLLPRAYGLYHPVHGVTSRGTPLGSASDLAGLIKSDQLSGFVAKPAEGWRGEGVVVITEIGSGGDRFVAQDGTQITLEELADRFQRDSGGPGRTGMVLQERLVPHASLEAIAPNGTHTVRVVTIADAEGNIYIPFAKIKMGSVGAMVDNVAAGGATTAFIDVESGTIGPGVSPEVGRTHVTHHTSGGTRCTGTEIPSWHDTIEAVERMARYSTGLRAIGWDLIVTENGPRIIEGNAEWDLTTTQGMNLPILQPRMVEVLKSHGLDVFAPDLPPLRLSKALQLLRLR